MPLPGERPAPGPAEAGPAASAHDRAATATPPGMRLAAALTRSWAKPRPDALARLLQPLSWLYRGLWGLRRLAYATGLKPRLAAPVPVLVVGNLVAGGAGKTPTVIALLPRLRALGFTPGVISRGHGRLQANPLHEVRSGSPAELSGDEPLLIHLRTGAPVVVGADRLQAARQLCQAHPEVDLLVADDGLQHWRLARQAQLVVFDERGAGNGLLLPAGPLREPLASRPPPHSLVLYTSGRASTAWPGCTGQRRITGVVALADWWQGAKPPTDHDPWAPVRGRPLLAAAGLARPQAFFDMLQAQGLDITPLPLPDHARFNALPWPADTPDVVLTEKDAVKLRPAQLGRTRVWVAGLDFAPEPAFDAALAALLAPWTPAPKDRP